MNNLIEFELFKQHKHITHGYTTRLEGASQGAFASLNMGFNRGDAEENVIENYRRVTKTLGLSTQQLVLSDQIHSDVVMAVDERHLGMGITKKSQIKGVDGLMTDKPGVGLTTFYADCVPLFFYDPIHQAIALSHSGWRGTVKKIGLKTLDQMRQHYGTNPEEVLIGIGPAIGQCCYEVSKDVKKEFDLSFNDDIIAKIMSPTPKNSEKYMLNLKLANQLMFKEAGVKASNIEVSSLCTSCHDELFFSHRRMGASRGSHVAIFALR
ncbi:peptidoglycan editing factor PgeF [Vallitaleaceae bacterium 9-2]